MMWIIHPVFIFTLCMLLFNVQADYSGRRKKTEDTVCNVLHPLLYGIIGFLVVLVVILLILLFKLLISMKTVLTRDTNLIASNMGESTTLHQNIALSVSPSSGNGGDNSSATSSGTHEGSGCQLADLSSSSQRYASLQGRLSKSSDYINVSESASPVRVGFHDKITDIDYVNVKESRRKKINRKGQANCDDSTTSVSSDTSDDSDVKYSKVVLTKMDK